jgi:hypothetical protein
VDTRQSRARATHAAPLSSALSAPPRDLSGVAGLVKTLTRIATRLDKADKNVTAQPLLKSAAT